MEKEKYCWKYGLFCGSEWEYDTALEAYEAGWFWLSSYDLGYGGAIKVYRFLIEEVQL
jgi:hypothetical protein